MASHYRLSHENVTAIVREMRRRAGGENVGYARSLGALYRMWLRSPEHRRNILDPRWRTIGVGIVRAHGWYWGTVLFLN